MSSAAIKELSIVGPVLYEYPTPAGSRSNVISLLVSQQECAGQLTVDEKHIGVVIPRPFVPGRVIPIVLYTARP